MRVVRGSFGYRGGVRADAQIADTKKASQIGLPF